MRSYNLALLIGNLTRDPELRSTPDGKAVCEFTVAVNGIPRPGGESRADFIPVVAWEKLAEACAKHLKKGSLVHVEARLRQERWEKEGKKLSRLTVVASSVNFLDRKKEASGEPVAVAAGGSDEPAQEEAAEGDVPV